MIKEVVLEINFKVDRAKLALKALSVDDIEFKRDVSIYSELMSNNSIRYVLRSSSPRIGPLKNLFNDLTRCLRVLLEL